MDRDNTEASIGNTMWQFVSEYGEIDFSFNLSSVAMADVIQMVSTNCWTGFLVVQCTAKKAQVYFEEGQLVSCCLANLQGPYAFYSLFSWKRGKGIFCQLKKEMEPQFDGTTMSYLLEASRIIDEWEQMKNKKPLKRDVRWDDIPPQMRFFIEVATNYPSLAEIEQRLHLEGVELYFMVEDCQKQGWLTLPENPQLEETAMLTTRKLMLINSSDKIDVLIIDDSMIARKILKKILTQDARFSKVTECKCLKEGVQKIEETRPHVVALDVILPEMNGVAAIPHVKYRPNLPIIMLSSYSEEGMEITFDALLGEALDFIGKPDCKDEMKALEARGNLVAEKLHRAARYPVEAMKKTKPLMAVSGMEKKYLSANPADKITLLGVGTGGYPALFDILTNLTRTPGTANIVVPYMQERFVDLFIGQLKKYCYLPISQAKLGDALRENHIYFIASPAFTSSFVIKENQVFSKIEANPHRMEDIECCKTFSHIMERASACFMERATAIVLSGIGANIGKGVFALKDRGGEVYLTDEWASSLPGILPEWAYEMPQTPREHLSQVLRGLACHTRSSW